MTSGPITSWQIEGETVDTLADFMFLGSKITADGDCSHEIKRCFLGGSDGKASAYNEGDLGSIPGLGRSPGEGNSNPLQYSCLPLAPKTWAQRNISEKVMETHSSTLAWEIPWPEETGGLQSMGSLRVGHD